jgi:hypothetical protein
MTISSVLGLVQKDPAMYDPSPLEWTRAQLFLGGKNVVHKNPPILGTARNFVKMGTTRQKRIQGRASLGRMRKGHATDC